MACWENEDRYNEPKYTSKFEDILDLLLTGSRLFAFGGEGTSQSTKRMAIFNDYESTFGRRSDILIIGTQNDELTNIEFKKAVVQDNLVIHQQSKNIRINSILNQVNLMTDTTDNAIMYYDFIGRSGCLAQLFVYEGVYVCQKVQFITIPARMLEMKLFRTSLQHSFVRKNHLINLDNKITLANLNKEQQFQLADVCYTISLLRSPPHHARPVQVYLSPSNANKRSRSVFEEEQK